MPDRLRALELFCGIGGCAAAVGSHADVAAAVDVNRRALAVYTHNFPHPALATDLATLSPDAFARWAADLWWLSPPCQPYTRRGLQRDVEDPRAAGLLSLLPKITAIRPPYIALENVPGFERSRSHALLLDVLDHAGYQFRERWLCPTELGVPNMRRRYYLVASQRGWQSGAAHSEPATANGPPIACRPAAPAWRFRVREILDAAPDAGLWVPAERVARYGRGFDVVEADDERAVTTCFTAGYGRSLVRSGSYLRTACGPRWFSPAEILRLLGFPPSFTLPPGMLPRHAWPLVGNSLSITVVRHVLQAFPELPLQDVA